MNKVFIFILAMAAGLTGIAIGIAAGRSNLSAVRRTRDARAHLEPARAVTPVKDAVSVQSNQIPPFDSPGIRRQSLRFSHATSTEKSFRRRNGTAKLYS